MNLKINRTIVLIGLGRMGKEIAKKLPSIDRAIFIDKCISEEIIGIATQKNALLEPNLEHITQADIVILAVNSSEVENIIADLVKRITNKCYLINIASSYNIVNVPSHFKVINVKIIAEASEIGKGNVPIVVIPNTITSVEEELIELLFKKFGQIHKDNIEKYQNINHIVAQEVMKTIFEVRKKLVGLNIPEHIIEVAIKNVMAGTCNGYPWSKNDMFIVSLLKEMQIKSLKLN